MEPRRAKKIPRANQINEAYYDRFNEPSFNQFGNVYHFIDTAGRLYRVADQNSDEFQNEMLRSDETDILGVGGGNNTNNRKKECTTDEFGRLKLFVKLRKRTSQWFTDDEVLKPFSITVVNEHRTRRDKEYQQLYTYHIKVENTIITDAKRRTGTVWVRGLNKQLCDTLLMNQSV
jgi:hypothetical protein